MLQNLINLVKENAGDAIINNSEVPNDQNDNAIEVTGHSIVDTLKSAVSSGNISQLTDLFSGDARGSESTQLASDAKSNVVSNLIEKLGLSPEIASKIAHTVVPLVMAKLVGKTNDPNNSSFNIKDILGSLTGGGSGFDLGTILGQFGASNSNDQKDGNNGGIGGKLNDIFGG